MKKTTRLLALLLALMMILTLASCGKKDEPEETPAPTEAPVEETEAPAEETEAPAETVEPGDAGYEETEINDP